MGDYIYKPFYIIVYK